MAAARTDPQLPRKAHSLNTAAQQVECWEDVEAEFLSRAHQMYLAKTLSSLTYSLIKSQSSLMQGLHDVMMALMGHCAHITWCPCNSHSSSCPCRVLGDCCLCAQTPGGQVHQYISDCANTGQRHSTALLLCGHLWGEVPFVCFRLLLFCFMIEAPGRPGTCYLAQARLEFLNTALPSQCHRSRLLG